MTDPLNKEKIEDYATCMKNGDVFPMIVVERTKKGKYTILGGNQRMAALKTIDQNAFVDCYIVDPLISMERELIIRSLNSRHGWGSTKEDRVEHAVYLVRKEGVPVSAAARAMVVSEYTIYSRIRSEDEKATLAKEGIDLSRVANGTVDCISRICDLETKKKIARIVVEHKVPETHLTPVVSGVDSAKSNAEKQKIIATFAKQLEHDKELLPKSGVRKPRKEKLLRHLKQLSDFLESGNDGKAFSTLDELSCSSDDLGTIRVLFAKIKARINCVCEVAE